MKTGRIILILTVFSIAMGYMESAVVIYLREIFYPEGFAFPLSPIGSHIMLTEILREAATLIMLITIAILAGRTKTERFGFFIFCFAVWDITYYLVLYLLIGWPESMLTWDVLFLIPLTWVGPVLAPVLNSISMIIFALLIHFLTSKNRSVTINKAEWTLLIAGSLIIIISYTEDYTGYMLTGFSFGELFLPSKTSDLMEYAALYVPQSFAWWVFCIGKAGIVLGIFLFFMRNKKALSSGGLNNSFNDA